MNYRLAIRLAVVEGALLRVLGQIEHRGFRVLGCQVHLDAATYRVELDVAGEREGDLLRRQLMRLYDVQEVTVEVYTQAA